MHGVIRGTTIPLVYSLMGSKTKENYEELLAAIKNLNAMLDPHEVTIDSEIAAIEAIQHKIFRMQKYKTSFRTGKLAEVKVFDWRKNINKTPTYKLISSLS